MTKVADATERRKALSAGLPVSCRLLNSGWAAQSFSLAIRLALESISVHSEILDLTPDALAQHIHLVGSRPILDGEYVLCPFE